MTSIVLVDDHSLLRNGLAVMLREEGYNVLFEADNGKEFVEKMKTGQAPDVVLLDINMKYMDGYETAAWIRTNHPGTKVLALSMYDDEDAIIKMLKNGARGYILKDSHPSELKAAIESVLTKGFHYSEIITGRLMRSIIDSGDEKSGTSNLSDREV